LSIFSDVSNLLAVARRESVLQDQIRLAVQLIAATLEHQQAVLGMIAADLDRQTEILMQLRDGLVPKPAVAIRFNALINGHQEVGIVSFQLQDIQSVPLSLTFVDADGNPTSAPAGVTPVWASSDTTKVSVTPAADGLTAVASGASVLGDAQINVTAGALAGQLAVTVVAGPPASIQIVPGIATPARRR